LRRPARVAALVAAPCLVAAAIGATLTPRVAGATALTGTAGVDAGLPATASAVTLHGRGRFSGMSITVNQTKKLANQAVSVSWSGALPGVGVANNFVQIFQCWGDDDGTNPDNPGPPPEQCEYGGQPIGSALGKIPADAIPSLVYTRGTAKDIWTSSTPGNPTWFDENTFPQPPLEGTPWSLAPGNDPAAGVLVTARFQGGKVSVGAGCNSYTGAYTLTGSALTISHVVATTTNECSPAATGVEKAYYLALLPKVALYDISTWTLTLLDSDGQPLLAYQPAQCIPSADPGDSQCYDVNTGTVWMPFRAVDGNEIRAQVTSVPFIDQGVQTTTPAWANPYFDFNTTNEKDWARTYQNGTGSELFQVDTGLEAPGLGCGQAKQVHPDGSTTVPKCWLVVVPRGSAADEDPAQQGQADTLHVQTSPLTPRVWASRIAFPLDFNPVDSTCKLGSDERRMVGSELAVGAITSWQPTLCATPGSKPYAFSAISDNQARQQVASGVAGAAGMAVVTEPYSADEVDPSDPPVYAPLTLSGVVIGMNVEREDFDRSGKVQEPAETQIKGTRITTVNLTPRLVAKLLTESYSRSFQSIGPRPADYNWLKNNPQTITFDEDFLRFNPEFRIISVGSPRTMTNLTVEFSTSDAAAAVWRWILADPEAKTWLDGTPDPWGMNVNPYYATTASANRNGAPFGDPVPNSFPKNDPYCFQSPPLNSVTPRPLCLSDFNPYVNTMVLAASDTRSANDGGATSHDDGATHQSSSTWWSADGPQALGTRSILSITDSASAARFGLQTARLSQAGDDGDTRSFIAADTASLVAAQRSMVPSAVDPTVLVNDPSAQDPGAYPLSLLTYAAAFPADLSQSERDDYARFINYAVGAGQTPGVDFGNLPPGYAPLRSSLVTTAQNAATDIKNGTVPTTTTTTTTTTAPPTTTTVAPTTTATPTTTTTTPATTSAPFPAGSLGGGSSSGGSSGSGSSQATSGSPSSPASSESTLAGATPSTSPTTTAPAPASSAATTLAPATLSSATTATPPKRGVTATVLNTATGQYALPVLFGLALLAAAGALLLDPKVMRSFKSRLRPRARR
jgi:hypothetical protein